MADGRVKIKGGDLGMAYSYPSKCDLDDGCEADQREGYAAETKREEELEQVIRELLAFFDIEEIRELAKAPELAYNLPWASALGGGPRHPRQGRAVPRGHGGHTGWGEKIVLDNKLQRVVEIYDRAKRMLREEG